MPAAVRRLAYQRMHLAVLRLDFTRCTFSARREEARTDRPLFGWQTNPLSIREGLVRSGEGRLSFRTLRFLHGRGIPGDLTWHSEGLPVRNWLWGFLPCGRNDSWWVLCPPDSRAIAPDKVMIQPAIYRLPSRLIFCIV